MMCEKREDGSVLSEFKLLWQLAAPSVLISLFSMLQWTYTTTYLGTNFGTDALTGFSLANLTGNLAGLSVVIGFLSACDTLQPQAFAQKRFKYVGWMAIKSYIVCVTLLAILSPVWMNIDTILISLDQPEEPARLAKRFLSTYGFAYPGVAFIETALRFYRSQNVTFPFLLIVGVGLIFHPIWVKVFVEWLQLGFDGAPLAHCASVYFMCFCILILNRHFPQYHHPETLPSTLSLREIFLEMTNLHDLWMILRLGIPGILSMSEWWFWETVCFFSGEFGTVSLAAHSIAYSLIPICFMIPLGFGSGMTTRVASLVAEKKVRLAKRLSTCAVLVCMFLVTVSSSAVFIFRERIVQAFTNDPMVEDLCKVIWPYVVAFIFLDGLMGTFTGIVRALSLQSKMSLAVFMSLWVLGVPLIWILAKEMGRGLEGIWQGMPTIYVVLNSLLFFSIYRLDWDMYASSIEASFAREPEHILLGQKKVLKAKVSGEHPSGDDNDGDSFKSSVMKSIDSVELTLRA